MRGAIFSISLHISILILFAFEPRNSIVDAKKDQKTILFPPCASCKVLIESFKKGLERTKRGKFEGGNSAWEENKLGSYLSSEVRLIEIQESLCNDVEQGQAQCHALAGELESAIEDWWFNHQNTHPEIFDFICIEKAKRCCPKDHFGPECTKCLGYPDRICNNNGKCKGSGSRKGNGDCLCDKGYAGKDCSSCSIGHYVAYKDDNKLLCAACHAACDGPCSGPGPNDCDKCAKGWRMVENKGCHDIDECILSKTPCPKNQFCVNNEGSFACLVCDKACQGCTGDGPDMCVECAENHVRDENICINSETIDVKKKENFARYATYFGLGVATCIIFQKNVYISGFIGVLVAAYITMSEYTISRHAAEETIPNMDNFKPAT